MEIRPDAELFAEQQDLALEFRLPFFVGMRTLAACTTNLETWRWL